MGPIIHHDAWITSLAISHTAGFRDGEMGPPPGSDDRSPTPGHSKASGKLGDLSEPQFPLLYTGLITLPIAKF